MSCNSLFIYIFLVVFLVVNIGDYQECIVIIFVYIDSFVLVFFFIVIYRRWIEIR